MGLCADVDARWPFDGFEQKMAGWSFTSETETAPSAPPLKISDPLWNDGKVSTLPLLDLWTAFHAIDHRILHPRLGIILASAPLVSIMSGGVKSGGRSCKQLCFLFGLHPCCWELFRSRCWVLPCLLCILLCFRPGHSLFVHTLPPAIQATTDLSRVTFNYKKEGSDDIRYTYFISTLTHTHTHTHTYITGML